MSNVIPIEKTFANSPYVDRWSPNNTLKPHEVTLHSSKKILWICEVCEHEFEQMASNTSNGKWCTFCTNKCLCENWNCEMCYNKSFLSHPKSEHWSDKNEDIPRNIFLNSNKKYLFNCPDCLHEIESTLYDIVNGKWCGYCNGSRLCSSQCEFCFEKSFASHPKSSCWSKRNKITPRNVCKHSANHYWFDCPDCKHTFSSSLLNISNGKWCPYCNQSLLCFVDCDFCFKKSFASHPKSFFWSKRNKITPRNVCKHSANHYLFDCPDCKHTFSSALLNISDGTWCPYCNSHLLCFVDCDFCFKKSFASHPKSFFWSKRNEITPRNTTLSSNKKYWFICEKNHEFFTTLSDIVQGRWCGFCKNKTEQILYDKLKPYYPELEIQKKFDWSKNINHLPFDFVIEVLKIIIELDGGQHFKQVSIWKSPQETQAIDKYKMKCASEQGYSIVRLLQNDVWFNTYNWLEELISNIEMIKSSNKIQTIYMCKNDEYKNYIN